MAHQNVQELTFPEYTKYLTLFFQSQFQTVSTSDLVAELLAFSTGVAIPDPENERSILSKFAAFIFCFDIEIVVRGYSLRSLLPLLIVEFESEVGRELVAPSVTAFFQLVKNNPSNTRITANVESLAKITDEKFAKDIWSNLKNICSRILSEE